MLSISSREEFIRAIKANDIVIIGYFDLDSEEGKFFNKVFTELSKYVDSRILVLHVDTSNYNELVSDLQHKRCIRVFIGGKLVFEQYDLFGDLDLDIFVLRRSIRSVLRENNVNYRI
ncbi:MAG: thioredoxin [Desulfurococcaceae archaeon]|uniref:Thioredoxin n=1 Tax=Staphylothermus marinus TaxID=2280 RepID=A0A7C4HCN6_STAMA